ncbi:MAG TPA: M1 family metallopeptidase, partial [Ferruginibacter sp.]|nr:M1 family metallopeptidase [Ferruginibacter sp.]
HLWPNAYKNDRTAFSDQLLENGNTKFYFSGEDKKGYINRLDFKADQQALATEDHPQHQDIIKLILKTPLAPGAQVSIETDFHVQLPEYISRSGYSGQSFFLTQWYPKPAVYDREGWHPMPYLDQGEFYSEFGSFDVSITTPAAYQVAATGLCKDSLESNGWRTLHYYQDRIHDFAWFADKHFVVEKDTLNLHGKTIQLAIYKHPGSAAYWKDALTYLKRAITYKSTWLGDYPYEVMSVVEIEKHPDAGGMEYPTITLVDDGGSAKELDMVIHHETGHNWFYGILASNERAHPWMDEGMNTYYDRRYQSEIYGNASAFAVDKMPAFIRNRYPNDLEGMALQTVARAERDQPFNLPADRYSSVNYGLSVYFKAARWMEMLETKLGRARFDSLMKEYFVRWQFKHPYPEDFKLLMQSGTSESLQPLFDWQHTKGAIPPVAPKKKMAFTFLGSLKATDQLQYIAVTPMLGYNRYDGLMLGGMMHNYQLPIPNLRFFAIPLYGTGSGSLNGLTRLGYEKRIGSRGNQLEVFVSGARFTVDQFKDSAGTKYNQPVVKLVPGLRFTWFPKDARKQWRQTLQWKYFTFWETGLAIDRDSNFNVTGIRLPSERRYLQEISYNIRNNRKLYPYDATLKAENGPDFLRLSLTASAFLNYAQGGGATVRFFAGKFIYLGNTTLQKKFRNQRYNLNLTGANGYEDYTYSDYFIGRNEFEGLLSQQIMNRDGAFKVRTDLLFDKVGRSDDWLTAINVSTTIPKKLDPLQVLPIRIPLKLFLDVGTYAGAWKSDAGTSRFLYDAGLQVSLLKNTIQWYIPLLYSKVYRDYFQSTLTEKRFRKIMSFSIDIQQWKKELGSAIPFF